MGKFDFVQYNALNTQQIKTTNLFIADPSFACGDVPFGSIQYTEYAKNKETNKKLSKNVTLVINYLYHSQCTPISHVMEIC